MKAICCKLSILLTLFLLAACSVPDQDARYASDPDGLDLFTKPDKESRKLAHAGFADPLRTGPSEQGKDKWVHATLGSVQGWVLESFVTRNDPMISLIREKAAPLLHRNPQDVGVRRLEDGMYEVTNFAITSNEMSATIYDLWMRRQNTAVKTARLGPGRNLVQVHLNNDQVYDYLLEGGMPGTGREFAAAFLGGPDGTVEKVSEISAPSDEAPRITSIGRCEKAAVETSSAKPRRYKFDCVVNKFTENKQP